MLRWMKDNWKVVRAVIRPHASTFVFLLFVQLISVCLAVLIPLLNMELIDLFVYEKMGRKHFMYVLAYIVFLIVKTNNNNTNFNNIYLILSGNERTSLWMGYDGFQ